jgi:A118 family predicted phage portal protein
MGIIQNVRGFFMNLFRLYDAEKITGIGTCVSSEMKEAIDLWGAISAHSASWNEKYPSCGTVDTISTTLASAIGEEISIETANQFISSVMKKLDENSFVLVNNIVSLGSSIVRPVFSNGRLQFEIIPIGNYLPTSYDFDGTLTGCVVLRHIFSEGNKYLLCENHEYKNNAHEVSTKLYKTKNNILQQIDLTSIAQTAEITPYYAWENVERPMIIEFRNRAINKIDGTKVPCAMISGAEPLIELADKQFFRINWEQEGGELKVFADNDLFQPIQGAGNKSIKANIDTEMQRLFVKFNGDVNATQKIITHSPTLRTDAQAMALQEIFKRIEQTCGVGRGTLSDMQDATQTATQYTGGKKAFYSVVDAIESELEEKYKDSAYVFAYMASAYLGVKFDPEVTVKFNDMIRKDPLQMKQIAMQEVSAGIKDRYEYRMEFFGEDEETARLNTPEMINTLGM